MAKCMKKGCERSTEEDSNYCVDHQPGKSPGKTVLKLDRSQDGSGRGTASNRGKPGPRPPPK